MSSSTRRASDILDGLYTDNEEIAFVALINSIRKCRNMTALLLRLVYKCTGLPDVFALVNRLRDASCSKVDDSLSTSTYHKFTCSVPLCSSRHCMRQCGSRLKYSDSLPAVLHWSKSSLTCRIAYGIYPC